jgi:signal transduction histidine kinase/DNA-binding response OmpR family regulator
MKSILAKLALLQLLFTLLLGSVLYVLLERDSEAGLREAFVRQGRGLSIQVARDIQLALSRRSPASVQTLLLQQIKDRNLAWGYLASPDGEILAHTFGRQFPRELLSARNPGGENWYDLPESAGAKAITVFYQPVSRGKLGALYVGLDRGPLLESVRRMRIVLISALAVGLLLCVLLFTWIVRRLLSPIHALTRAALELKDDQSGEFKWVAAKSGDELGVLTNAFNGMLAVIRHRTEWLEERVQARTAELSKANAELAVEVVERQHAEREATLAREAAETAARAKSAFVANMSHELRTPLNGILGMSEFIEVSKLDPQQREYFGIIRDSARNLLASVNAILDFSKIESGKVDLDMIDFDLPALVYETVKPLTMQARENEVELLYNIDPAVPDLVHGDPVRLRQVLTNLVGNAVKFTSKGEILISVAVESSAEDSMLLHFSVRDTGIGVPENKQASIFEPFQQADGSMTRRFGGTGLGLSICSRLVRLMGGDIWLESEEGQGSTFHFTARLSRALGDSLAVIQSLDKHIAGLRVLVVDGNATSREILHDALTRAGMCAVVRPDGFTGFDALVQAGAGPNPFHVLITEYELPGEDGLALAKRVRKTAALSGLPILLLYKGGEIPEPGRCLVLGIGGTLAKPFEELDLQRAILKVLHQQPLAKPPEPKPVLPCLTEAAGLHILLAEDNRVNQLITMKLLSRLGHFVVVAGDGRAALEQFKKQRFDVVLMDLQMPEMDGYASAQAIREYEKNLGRHTPIIALTAHAMDRHRDSCLAAGMEGFVSKPVNVRELEEQINLLVPHPVAPAL